MPRPGDEQPSRHRRVFLTMVAAILAAIVLVGTAHLVQAPILSSLRAWVAASKAEPDRHRKLDGLTMMEALPSKFIPTAENGRRLVVIGDIHGMAKSLDRLLEHISFDPATDHIVSAGDMVNKGPHSAAVVARLMRLGASAVRGNHEDHVLLALVSAEEQDAASMNVTYPEFQARRSKKEDLETARQLSREQIKWLAQRPLILSADHLAMYIVHAGLVPGIRPAKQDPWAVMNMRSLVEPPRDVASIGQKILKGSSDLDNQDRVERSSDDVEARVSPEDLIPVDTHEGHTWARLWDRHQASTRKSRRRTIVYGHDAKRGLTVGKYTFGLDSGCANGGELTALVIHVSKKGNVAHKIRQVPCKKE